MKDRVEYRLDDSLDDCLCDSIRHSGDGQRELHTNTVSFWDGQRSGILFTHFVGKASQYLRHGG